MEPTRDTKQRISAEAVEWLLQQQRPEAAIDSAAFSEWLLRSPAHIEEYLAVSAAWEAVNLPDSGQWSAASLTAAAAAEGQNSNVITLHRPDSRSVSMPEGRAQRRSLRRRRLSVVAASLVLGAAIWAGLTHWPFARDYSTAIAEQRSFGLEDGSVVFLNTDSLVRVRWTATERHIDLIRGEARFQVAKNPQRPFVVATREATVRALGTIFNVRAERRQTQVAVIEGHVEVRSIQNSQAAARARSFDPPYSAGLATGIKPTLELMAGERAAVTSDGIEQNVGPTLERVEAWTERRLVFRDNTLIEVVAEFNRYRPRPLYVDDSELIALRISGSFDSNDPESLVGYLEKYVKVLATHQSDGSIYLSTDNSASGTDSQVPDNSTIPVLVTQ